MNATKPSARNRPKLVQSLINAALVAVATLIAITSVDQVLRAMGFPSEFRDRVTHPPNISKVRQTIEFTYEFKTNELGLRDDPLPSLKAPGTHRVLVVGDSFVEGVGVGSDQTFSALLEQTFSRGSAPVLFLNAGLSGQGPQKYQAVIEQLSETAEADGILLCLFANDLWDTGTRALKTRSRRKGPAAVVHSLWPRISVQVEKLVRNYRRKKEWEDGVENRFIEKVADRARQLEISEEAIARWIEKLPPDLVAAANVNQIKGPILSYGLLNPRFWSDSIDVDTEEARQKWESMSQILSDTIAHARAMNKEIAVVYIPSVFQYDPASHSLDRPWPSLGSVIRSEWLNNRTAIQNLLQEFARFNEVAYLDLTPPLRRQFQGGSEPLNWKYDEHLNPEGHRVVAQLIAAWLDDEQVFSFLNAKEKSPQRSALQQSR